MQGSDPEERINTLAQWLFEARHLVIFTGAGISTESGLPDFRGPDAKDRRVINISLTDHGRAIFGQCRELVKQNIRKKYLISQQRSWRTYKTRSLS
jgi:hypothetical protein